MTKRSTKTTTVRGRSAGLRPRGGGPGTVAGAQATGVPLYQKRATIYQQEVDGVWQRVRVVALFLLAGLYIVMPWVNYRGHQAVWLDVPARKFHLFAITFWPQDFILLSLLLICGAFGLFFFTNLAGRLWCGFGCPQTVWTKFFMWIEWLTEGDRNQRILLDRAPWSAGKVARKAAKHAGWLAACAVVGFTFVGYFEPIRDLLPRVARADVTGGEVVFLAIASLALYFDAGFMREQICIYACPYARFQGVMFDRHTWTIFYDPRRGEPRGHRGRGVDRARAGLGDCIDCGLCVAVCPTGIDIRDGTQIECIGCAACIDACDEVMDKMSYPRGLVRYSTEAAIAGERARVLRPRLAAYGALFAVVLAVFTVALLRRVPLQLDVLRDRARLYRVTADGSVENSYTLKILNMDQQGHTFSIQADASAAGSGIELEGSDRVKVAAGDVREVSVRLRAPASERPAAPAPVDFLIEALDDPRLVAREESRFLAPPPASR